MRDRDLRIWHARAGPMFALHVYRVDGLKEVLYARFCKKGDVRLIPWHHPSRFPCIGAFDE
jgi:hypothetical protein